MRQKNKKSRAWRASVERRFGRLYTQVAWQWALVLVAVMLGHAVGILIW